MNNGGSGERTDCHARPIYTAPVRMGERWGPVFLAPGPDGGWVSGYWENAWYTDWHHHFTPLWWFPQPPIPD